MTKSKQEKFLTAFCAAIVVGGLFFAPVKAKASDLQQARSAQLDHLDRLWAQKKVYDEADKLEFRNGVVYKVSITNCVKESVAILEVPRELYFILAPAEGVRAVSTIGCKIASK